MINQMVISASAICAVKTEEQVRGLVRSHLAKRLTMSRAQFAMVAAPWFHVHIAMALPSTLSADGQQRSWDGQDSHQLPMSRPLF